MIRWNSRVSDHFLSSAARTAVNGCVRGTHQDLEHGVAEIAALLVLVGLGEEGVHVHLVEAVASRDLHQTAHPGWGSWPTSSPARSADSSDLRNHSRSAVTMAMIATLPSGIQATFTARLVRKSRIVRYTE
ncbi:hypothetical protein SBADM41S_02950 [Streptomyces badius]